MIDSKKDELKRLLTTINRELKIHGGNENTIKLSKLKEDEIEFLLELINSHLDEYKKFVRLKLEEFHSEDIKALTNYKMPVSVHKIDLPENFEENYRWQLVIGRLKFGTTEIILDLQKWEIVDDTLIG